MISRRTMTRGLATATVMCVYAVASAVASGAWAADFRIVAVHSGKCMDVAGRRLEDRTNIQQYECHGGENQRWQIASPDKPKPPFILIRSVLSRKCLDVEGRAKDDGANVQQYTCHGGDNQLWRLEPAQRGTYRIQSAGSGKCLDVAGANRGDHANVQQWTCHGGPNQLWRLDRP